METIGRSYRTMAGSLLHLSMSVGFMLQPLIASSVRSDVEYQLAALASNVIFLAYAM
jgi:hypothetical protein